MLRPLRGLARLCQEREEAYPWALASPELHLTVGGNLGCPGWARDFAAELDIAD